MNKRVKAKIEAQIEVHENQLIESANAILGLLDKEHLPYNPDYRARNYATGARQDLSNQIKNLRKNVSIYKDEMLAAEYEISQLETTVNNLESQLDNHNNRITRTVEMHSRLGSKVYEIEAKTLSIAEYTKQEISAVKNSIALIFTIIIGLTATLVLLATFS
jgi:chromosome segregation ATPase